MVYTIHGSYGYGKQLAVETLVDDKFVEFLIS